MRFFSIFFRDLRTKISVLLFIGEQEISSMKIKTATLKRIIKEELKELMALDDDGNNGNMIGHAGTGKPEMAPRGVNEIFKEIAQVATHATMNKSMGFSIAYDVPIEEIEELLAELRQGGDTSRESVEQAQAARRREYEEAKEERKKKKRTQIGEPKS